MINFLQRLVWVFSRRADIEAALKEVRKNHLQLCAQHQQRDPGVHYASHNCDFCKVLKERDGNIVRDDTHGGNIVRGEMHGGSVVRGEMPGGNTLDD